MWVKKLIRFFPSAVVVALLMPVVVVSVREIGKTVGLVPVTVSVMGTGSMYPSLFWDKTDGGPEDTTRLVIPEYRSEPLMYHRFGGLTFLGHTYLKRSLGFGDMVAFQNRATQSILAKEGQDVSAGFIKRIIGLPGDSIELRDGFVYRNGALLSEPYIASPRSTYGGDSILDCQVTSIPRGAYLVLGDNRKISSDSRYELGLVQEGDITFVLPYADQNIYKKLWRDTSKDAALMGQPTLDVAAFYALLNQARASHGVPPLSVNKALESAAKLRATGTASSQQKAENLAGYSNIIGGEFVSHGHYTAAELMQNLLAFKSTTIQIMNQDYQDVGVAAVDQKVKGCPVETIVGDLGGYIPATYDATVIKSWTDAAASLQSSLQSWQGAVSDSRVDQGKLQDLLTILRRRLDLAVEVSGAMKAQKWLTDSEKTRISADKADATSAEALATQLNGQ